MTSGKLFRKTIPFIWAKLLLGVIAVIVAIALLAAFLALGWLFGKVGLLVMAIVWIFVVRFVWYLIMRYFGYLVKAGHVAVIAEACRTGAVPKGQVGYGKSMVRKRFVTASVYSIVDKLISGAVKDIQRKIGRLGDRLDFVPGMEAVTGLAQFFVKISLGYVDECCLGWTFYNKEQGVFKSAADGVVLYTQNWKPLLKKAAWTMFKVILLTVIIALLIFVPVGILFKIMGWHPLIALAVAVLIAWVVKFAAMDSYIMVRMMTTYLDTASSSVIAFDLYGTLCDISAKFRELFQKGQKEEPQQTGSPAGWDGAGGTGQPGYQQMQRPQSAQPSYQQRPQSAQPSYQQRPQPAQYGYQQTHESQPVRQTPTAQQPADRPRFCGQCGARNKPGMKFCGSCGARLQQ